MFAKYKGVLIKVVIIAVALIVIAGAVFYKGYKRATAKYENIIKELEEENERLSDPVVSYEVATKEINIDLINSEIRDIAELATVEYLYTDAGKFEDATEIFGQEIPFTTKSFIAKWDGIIKAGIRVNKITTEINDLTKEIIVHLPQAEVLSHETDKESVETLDEKNGLFNPIKVEDVNEFNAASKEKMQKRAEENGILEKAMDNAKNIIYRNVCTDSVKEAGYSITFEVVE